MKNIPIVVGVTGHRHLRIEDYPLLKEKVKEELLKIKNSCANSSLVLLDSIASGADTLCAEIALELGYELIIPLPFENEEYQKDFLNEDLIKYNNLIKKASKVFEVTSLIDNKGKDYGYLQAGLYVAKHSHILLALWDGQEAKKDGCATAEIVYYTMNGIEENIIVPTPIATIIHIYTPRKETINLIYEVGHIIVYESNADTSKDTLLDTNAFNNDCTRVNGNDSIIEKDLLNSFNDDLKYYNDIYSKADELSIVYQKKYLKSLGVLSFLGFALAMSYLLYDELDLKCLSPLLIIILLISVYYLSKPKREKWHEKYLSYRTLAESLRIQFFVFASGVSKNVGDLFFWAIREDYDWIFKALKVLEPINIDNNIDRKEIINLWINDQLQYHKRSLKKNGMAFNKNNKLSLILLIITVLSYFLVIILEFVFPKLMDSIIFSINNNFLFINAGTDFTLRSLFKVLTGLVAAITLLITNYYGKLSLNNKQDDHRRYISLYEEAKKVIENPTDELIIELASEELFINSAWLTYSKENSPNIII